MRGGRAETVLMKSIFRQGICSAGLCAVIGMVLCLTAVFRASPAVVEMCP
jgi:hypothetical protein